VIEVHDAGFPVEMISGVPVVVTPKEIDITNADGFRAGLLRAAAHGSAAIVVDMTRTTFCDSAGVHAILGAYKRAKAEGGEVKLAVTATGVRRILAITALDRLLPVYATVAEALTSLQPPTSAPVTPA
jgi:anti-sigma B factor antagonist